MTEYLPDIVLPIDAAIGDLLKGLAAADAAIRSWARDVPDAAAGLDANMRDEGRDAGQAFVRALVDEANDGGVRVARDVSDRLRDERGRFVAAGHDSGDAYGDGFFGGLQRHLRQLRDVDLSGLAGVFSKVGGGLVGALPALVSMPSLIAAGVGALAPLVPTLTAATGVIGMWPAVIAGGVLAITTLKMAVGGLGEALKAGLSGNAAKFAEAMKQLAPAAQETVKAIIGLKPAFDAMKQSVQQSFFEGMGKSIQGLAGTWLPLLQRELSQTAGGLSTVFQHTMAMMRTPAFVGPATEALRNLRVSVVNAAGALPNILSGLNRLIQVGSRFGPGISAGIAGLSERFADFMNRVADSGQLEQWIQGGIDAVKAIMPLLKDLGTIVMAIVRGMEAAGGGATGVFGQLLGQLAEFSKSAEGAQMWATLFQVLGQYAALFGTALQVVLPIVGQLLGALQPLVSSLLGSLGTVLVSIGNALQPVIAQLAPFVEMLGGDLAKIVTALVPILGALAVAFGQQLTQTLIVLTPVFAELVPAIADMAITLLPALLPLITSLAQLFVALMPALVPFVQLLVDILVPTLQVLTPGLVALADGVTWIVQAITPAVASLSDFVGWLLRGADSADTWSSVGDWFVNLWHTITSAFTTGLHWLAGLPARIGGVLSRLPGMLADLASKALHGFVYAVGFGIMAVIRLWTELPGKVSAEVTSLWSTVQELTGRGVAAVIRWVTDMRTRFAMWVGRTWREARAEFREGVAAVVNFVKTLPDRVGRFVGELPGKVKNAVKGAGSWLYEAGRDILRGLVNGIRSMWDWAVGFMRSLASDLGRGFRDALGIHSPSTVFANDGESIVAGVVAGVKRRSGDAVRAVAGMLGDVTAGGVGGGGFAMAGAGGGGHVPIVINLGRRQLAMVHAELIPTAQRYKVRTGTSGLG